MYSVLVDYTLPMEQRLRTTYEGLKATLEAGDSQRLIFSHPLLRWRLIASCRQGFLQTCAQGSRLPSMFLTVINLLVLRLLVWELGLARLSPVSGLARDVDWDRDFIRTSTDPSWTACRLTGLAASILPGEHRARYAAEFGCELHDLAALGASRWGQWRFSCRILFGARELRRALLEPCDSDDGDWP